MNKGDLIDKIAEKSGMTKADSAKALNSTLEAINEALTAGDKITLVGFGTFGVTYRKERNGIDPKKKTAIKIADKVSVKFKAGKELSTAVDNKDLKGKLSK